MRFLVLALVFFLSISACFGGWMLMDHPNGRRLQMPVSMLENTPFPDFFWPGIILFVVFGLGSLLVAGLVIQRADGYHRWVSGRGLALVIWIGVQLALIPGYSWLQLLYGGLGLLLFVLGFRLVRSGL
jgi:hypothetical protein